MANSYTWPDGFRRIYDRAVESYRKGQTTPSKLFTADELGFLSTIGCSAQELFDFIEDFCHSGEPSYESVLLVTAIRRDYFLKVQQGQPSKSTINMDRLPSKQAAVAGIPWLPRIIEKARAKLRGEMPPELMYGCGGDRPFLKSVNLELADFLRLVWEAGPDTQKVVDAVVASMKNRQK